MGCAWCSCSCSCNQDYEWGYIPSTCCDIVNEWLIICSFSFKGFCSKSIVAICKICELYCELWVAYDAKYLGFKLGIAVAPLDSTCA